MGSAQRDVLRDEVAFSDEVVLLRGHGSEVVLNGAQDEPQADASLRSGRMVDHVLRNDVIEDGVVTGLLPSEHLLDDVPCGSLPHLVCYSAPIGALSTTLDATFFALADPTRRGILEQLGTGTATISQLADPFGLTINGMKKHVAVLEVADLVVTEKVGRTRECRLGPAGLREATDWIEGYRSAWELRLDRFGRFVERTARGEA